MSLRKKYFTSCGVELESEGTIFELLGADYSTHPTNIINIYVSNENGGKTCISAFKNSKGEFNHEVYLYKNLNDNHHYRSYCYSNKTLPKKYSELSEKLIGKYINVFA